MKLQICISDLISLPFLQILKLMFFLFLQSLSVFTVSIAVQRINQKTSSTASILRFMYLRNTINDG
jgi:hypothetical protein